MKATNYTARWAFSTPLAVGVAWLFLQATSHAQSAALSGWDNIWNDNFSGNSINYSRWEVADREFSPNNELQYYRPEQVTVGGGQLTITAVNQPLGNQQYRSGLIRTWQEHRFGRWEVRADLPWGQGMWPAIWLLPRNAAWPVGGEIDIMENIGSNTFAVLGSYHYNWTPGTPITSNQWYGGTDENGQPIDFAAGMHNYAVEWEPNQMRFYVDDNLYFSIDNPIQPQAEPMSLIINLAVGGNFPGNPDPNVFPQTFDIDHARYWTRDETELINPDFDRSGTSLNGWGTFGNAINNVSAQSEAVLDGTHSLKLFGQFEEGETFSGAFQGIAVNEGQQVTADASAFIRSEDSIASTSNELIMKLEYYSNFGAAFDSPDFLGEVPLVIADGSTDEDIWLAHQISGVAPEGAVEARVSFVFRQLGLDGGAVHIDAVSLVATDPTPGDFDNNGFVDGEDFLMWQREEVASPPSATDLAGWQGNFGASLGSLGAQAAVPEPSSFVAGLLGLSALLGRRRWR